MPKINLVQRKKQQITRKVASKGVVFLVKTTRNNQPYYVQRVDTDQGAVVWTTQRDTAMAFHTESGSQAFIRKHLKKRQDIEIIGIRSKHA